MSWIIDRIEGDLAIVQAGDAEFEVPVAVLPEGAAEGDVLRIVRDSGATDAAQRAVAGRIAALSADDGGDFSL